MDDFPDFVWDENKRASNLKKHNVDFEVARRMFESSVLQFRSDKPGDGEPRWTAVGSVDGVVLTVAYCVRDGLCRVISLRRAHKNERKKFSEHLAYGGNPPEERG